MAIQLRRGAYSGFDSSKMVAGEVGVVLSGDTNTSDGKSVYITFSPGDVKRLVTDDDLDDVLSDKTATSTPLMDGTADIGSSTRYALEDHVHPSDTSRVPTTREINGHALSTNVDLVGAEFGIGYGVCSTAASTSAKVVSISDFVLNTGAIVCIEFENGAEYGATLNINSTGAKPIRFLGSDSTILYSGFQMLPVGARAILAYDGSAYNVIASDTFTERISYISIDASNANYLVLRFLLNLAGEQVEVERTLPSATTSTAGVMSASDKTRLDNLVTYADGTLTILPSIS